MTLENVDDGRVGPGTEFHCAHGDTVTLFTVVNLVKLVPYYFLDQFDSNNLLMSAILLPLAPLGIWLGIKIHHKVNDDFNTSFMRCGTTIWPSSSTPT